MDKANGWQMSAIIIGLVGVLGSIIYAIKIENLIVAIVGILSVFILCMVIYGIGTLIEQNDIIIEILNKNTKK